MINKKVTVYIKIRYRKSVIEEFRHNNAKGRIEFIDSNNRTFNMYFNNIEYVKDEEDDHCVIITLKNAIIDNSSIINIKDDNNIKMKIIGFPIYNKYIYDDTYIEPVTVEMLLFDLGDKFIDLSGSIKLYKENTKYDKRITFNNK